MMAEKFDQLAYMDTLKEAGVNARIAEAHAKAQFKVFSTLEEEHLATKEDVSLLDKEINNAREDVVEVKSKVNKLDAKMDKFDVRIDKLETKIIGDVSALKTRVTSNVNSLETKVLSDTGQLNNKIDKLEMNLQNQIRGVSAKLTKLLVSGFSIVGGIVTILSFSHYLVHF
jgi:chromosome segregation ATPase